VQERAEQVLIHLARRARQVTGARLLCAGGGVAMNCVAIGAIIGAGLFDEVFVPPAPGDSGTAVGAAVAACLQTGGPVPAGIEHACYLGPGYPVFDPNLVPRPGLSARQVDDPAGFLAGRLAEGEIAGLFQSRVEAGPRALGNRSILASPLMPGVADRLNAAVKFREPFRPFAPVVLADKAAELLPAGPAEPVHVDRGPGHGTGPAVIPGVVQPTAPLLPSPGAASLLFPVADAELDTTDPAALASAPRPLPLAYVGNQYDHDDAFNHWFVPAAARFPHKVVGKWTGTARWPQVNFTGRCPFPEVSRIYGSALSTVLLLPDRYVRAGQITQRLPEAVLAGCLPITPARIACADRFTPPVLHAANGQHVIQLISQAQAAAGTTWHAATLETCLGKLGTFRLSRADHHP
jgi:hypothetical protein